MAEAAITIAPARRCAARLDGEALAGWGLAAPATALIFLLVLGPALGVLALSFTSWQFGAATLEWIGLANYAELARDPVFWKSLRNTLVYIGVVVPASVAGGLAVAMLVESDPSLRRFYRAAYFLPVASTLIAMAVVWQFLLHPSVGLVNRAWELLGGSPTDWLKNPRTALGTLCAIGIWQMLGLSMVLFLAGLKAVPGELYDAAAIDGADGAWERFRRVTWPLLGPTTLFVTVICAIRSFQVFDTVHVLTRGGPNKQTEELMHTIYAEGFNFFRAGYAAAITVLFLAVLLALTWLQMRAAERRVHYG
jgi:multiple sugar transport system permease protein